MPFLTINHMKTSCPHIFSMPKFAFRIVYVDIEICRLHYFCAHKFFGHPILPSWLRPWSSDESSNAAVFVLKTDWLHNRTMFFAVFLCTQNYFHFLEKFRIIKENIALQSGAWYTHQGNFYLLHSVTPKLTQVTPKLTPVTPKWISLLPNPRQMSVPSFTLVALKLFELCPRIWIWPLWPLWPWQSWSWLQNKWVSSKAYGEAIY